MVSSCVRSAHPLRPVTRWLVPPRIHPAPIHRDTADTTTRGYAADLPRARDRDLDLDPDSDPDFVRGSKASLSVTGYFCCFVCVCVCACPTTRLLTFFFFLFFFFVLSLSLSHLSFPRSPFAEHIRTESIYHVVPKQGAKCARSVVGGEFIQPSIYSSIHLSIHPFLCVSSSTSKRPKLGGFGRRGRRTNGEPRRPTEMSRTGQGSQRSRELCLVRE